VVKSWVTMRLGVEMLIAKVQVIHILCLTVTFQCAVLFSASVSHKYAKCKVAVVIAFFRMIL